MASIVISADCKDRRALEREVFRFLEKRMCTRTIELEADIRRALGVDGDDAEELLQAFSALFSLDMSAFRFDDHFGPEAGFEPISWLLSIPFGSRKRLMPLSVRALVDAAEQGRF
jgi:hypothetical protein